MNFDASKLNIRGDASARYLSRHQSRRKEPSECFDFQSQSRIVRTVSGDVFEFSVKLPRHAFSHRATARPGHLWRLFQETAIDGATAAGFPPAKLRKRGSAFVMRSMRVEHRAELTYGQTLRAKTWVKDFRRDIFSTREIRLFHEGQLMALAAQNWVHISTDLRIQKAPTSLIRAFAEAKGDGQEATKAAVDPIEGPQFEMPFSPRYVEMDPLDHLNHPAYIDIAEESICQALAQKGKNPNDLIPFFDEAAFKREVKAPHEFEVQTKLVGTRHNNKGDMVGRFQTDFVRSGKSHGRCLLDRGLLADNIIEVFS